MRPLLAIIQSLSPGPKMKKKLYNLRRVDDELTCSAQLPRKELEKVIKDYGIKSFISLRRPKGQKWYHEEIEVCKNSDLQYAYLKILGAGFPTKDEVLKMIEAIKKYPKPTHVQCKMGSDRTGLFCGIYLLLKGQSPDDAKNQCRRYYGNVRKYQRQFFDIVKNGYNGNDFRDWVKSKKF